MKRIAVLASGTGSNFQAILDHFTALGANAPAQVVLAVSDRPQAGVIERARANSIDAAVLRDAREPDSPEILNLLEAHTIDYVALAGYLRLIPAPVVDRFAGHMVNIHPALLPKHGGPGMYGLRVHQSVLNDHENISGATVHLVTHEYDTGPVLAQWPVPIIAGDDAQAVAERVLTVEHALYPRVLAALAADRSELFPLRPPEEYFAHPPAAPDELRRDIAARFESSASS